MPRVATSATAISTTCTSHTRYSITSSSTVASDGCVREERELAAHAFAKELCGLSFDPGELSELSPRL